MLEPLKDNFTIVIIGNWNVSIFSPQWVGKQVFNKKEILLEVGIEPGLTRKLIVENVVVIPLDSRLMLTVNNIEDNTLKEMEQATCKILSLLKHTPVRAVGINYGYKIKPVPVELTDKLPILLGDELASEELSVMSREYKWTIDYEKEKDKRLNISYNVDSEEAILKFNFHSAIKNTEAAIKSIENKIIGYRVKTIEIIEKAFGIQKEE